MAREEGEINLNSFVVVRTPEEISGRITDLQQQIEGHDVWIHTGVGKVPDPESRRRSNLLEAKQAELRWLQGEDVDIMDPQVF